eukprot:355228-Chlamydomonas_euryale.AAC.3
MYLCPEVARGDGDLDVGGVDDLREPLQVLLDGARVGRVHGHRDHARNQAAKKGIQELEAGWQHQHHAVAALDLETGKGAKGGTGGEGLVRQAGSSRPGSSTSTTRSTWRQGRVSGGGSSAGVSTSTKRTARLACG